MGMKFMVSLITDGTAVGDDAIEVRPITDYDEAS
jgi:hypothetical protein